MVSDFRDEILGLDSPFLLVVLVDLLESLFDFGIQMLYLFENTSLNVAVFSTFALLGDLLFKGEDDLFLLSKPAAEGFDFFVSYDWADTSLLLRDKGNLFVLGEKEFLVGEDVLLELLYFKVNISADLTFQLSTFLLAELDLGVDVYLLNISDDLNRSFNNSRYEYFHSNKFITDFLERVSLDLSDKFLVLDD
jgi:hypothetical protein